jgi:hypothetical protein
MNIVLISCVSQHLDHPAPAKHFYTSPWFRNALAYACRIRPDATHILSANYGLVDLGQTLEPYNLTLNNMSVHLRRNWSARVLASLRQRYDLANDHFVFLAGMRYREFLLPEIPNHSIPMEGLRIGEQLAFLRNAVQS